MRSGRIWLSLVAASCAAPEEELPSCRGEPVGIPKAAVETALSIESYFIHAVGPATAEIVDPERSIGLVKASSISSALLELTFADAQRVLVLLGDVPFSLTSSTVHADVRTITNSVVTRSSLRIFDAAQEVLLLASWVLVPPAELYLGDLQLTYEEGAARCRDECGTHVRLQLRARASSEEIVIEPNTAATIAGLRVANGNSRRYIESPARCTDQGTVYSGSVIPVP